MSTDDEHEVNDKETYAERLEARKERYRETAQRLRDKSSTEFEQSLRAIEQIPMGQPILVGHHSERRHRRDLERSDNAMRRSIEASEKAKHYERRAKTAGRSISSDDEEAVTKLEQKLAKLEANQAYMKKLNGEFRSGGIDALSCTEETKEKLRRSMNLTLTPDTVPFPPYALQNNNANIRSAQKRIEELKAAAEREPAPDVEGDGFVLRENVGENRVQFLFDTKPPKDTCAFLRRNGFVFSRRNMAWQRQLNNAGLYAAQQVLTYLKEIRA